MHTPTLILAFLLCYSTVSTASPFLSRIQNFVNDAHKFITGNEQSNNNVANHEGPEKNGELGATVIKDDPEDVESPPDVEVPVVNGYKQGDPCPAPEFKDVCNDCTCGADGKSAGCTRMMCGPMRRA